MSFASELQSMANELINEFGAGLTFKGQSLDGGTYAGNIVFTAGTKASIPTTYIGKYNRIAYITDTKIQPGVNDLITVGTDSFSVVNAIKYSPDGATNICWQLLLTT